MVEIFFWDLVNSEESKCTVTENKLILTVKKLKQNVEWPSLESLHLDKIMKQERRDNAIKQAHLLNAARNKRNEGKQICQIRLYYDMIAFDN